MPKQQSKGGNGSGSAKPPEPTQPTQPTNPAAPGEAAVTQYQAFAVETVHRSVLKGASYNPRHITARAKLKLKESLKRVGLVQPIVWNKQTGNIVGGHQRLSQLDTLEGSGDYRLTVAVVDVPMAREKELNVLLNNSEVGGEWDMEKLKAVLTDVDLNLLNTGFDTAEYMKLFGEAPGLPEQEHQDKLAKQLAAMHDAYDTLAKNKVAEDDTDFYNVVVFASTEERKEFLAEFGFEENRYLDGRTLMKLVRELKEAQATPARGKGK